MLKSGIFLIIEKKKKNCNLFVNYRLIKRIYIRSLIFTVRPFYAKPPTVRRDKNDFSCLKNASALTDVLLLSLGKKEEKNIIKYINTINDPI